MDVTLDFETYYDASYSLSKMTTMEYIHHESFEPIMLSIGVLDQAPITLIGAKDIDAGLRRINWDNVNAIAHNGNFDHAILAWRYGIHPAKLSCTLAMAMPFHGATVGGSLAKLAQRYNLPDKGVAVHGMLGKRLADMTPQEVQAYAEYCDHDRWLCGELYKIFYELLPRRELSTIDATLRMYTDPRLLVDPGIVEPHLAAVRAMSEDALRDVITLLESENLLPDSVHTPKIIPGMTMEELRIAAMKKHCSSAPKFSALMAAMGVNVPLKLNKKGTAYIPALAKTDPGMEDMLSHSDPAVVTLAEARIASKSTLAITRAQRFLTLATLGALPFPLKYYGAEQTGRWSAWDSINMQNLPRKSPLRDALTAPKGYTVVSGDLSQIELRTGLFLARQLDKLQALEGGRDLYRESVSDALHVPYDDVTPDQRQVGKVTQLSAIFGTSAKTIRRTIWLMARVRIDEPTASVIHATYRRNHPYVVAAWNEGNTALQMLSRGIEGPIWGDQCYVTKQGIRKPSGLVVRYPGLKQRMGDNGRPEWVYSKRLGKTIVDTKIYGAKVFQNLVQSIARDVMSVIVARVNDARAQHPHVHPVGIIHDELISLVPTECREAGAQLVHKALTTRVSFCPNIPLACELETGATYGTSAKWSPPAV